MGWNHQLDDTDTTWSTWYPSSDGKIHQRVTTKTEALQENATQAVMAHRFQKRANGLEKQQSIRGKFSVL